MSAPKFKKPFRLISPLLLCILLCGCQKNIAWDFPAPEHTEFVVDGEYKPFNVPRKTMEKLMELIEAEDADSIYEVFSSDVRENVESLSEQIRELIRFTKENVTVWDFKSGSEKADRRSGITISKRIALYEFQTESGTYRCDISDVIKNDTQKETIGFSSISIFPEELSKEYASNDLPGISIVYRAEDMPQDIWVEQSPMERLMQLTDGGNTDTIYEVFTPKARRDVEGLQEKISELTEFLQTCVISWEPYTWTENIETINGAKTKTREMFFYLHTDNGLYRCDIREVLESSDRITGTEFSSISIFPALYPGERPTHEDEAYQESCTWGRDNTGICIVYMEEGHSIKNPGYLPIS